MKKSLMINALLLVSSFVFIMASVNVFFIYLILDKTVSLLLLIFFIISICAGMVILLLSSINLLKNFEKREKEEIKINMDYLSEDERTVLNLILNRNGTMLQNSIVNETGFSKVRVSRIISSLEAKGFVEKRRKGVTNEIVLKRETGFKKHVSEKD